MFCSKCGSKVYDDSIYCSYCGFKLHREDEEAQTLRQPAIKPESQVSPADNEKKEVAPVMEPLRKTSEQEVVPVNIMVQPVPDTIEKKEAPTQPKSVESNEGQQFLQYDEGGGQYLLDEQPADDEAEKGQKNIMAFSVISAIFAVLTIVASVFEMLDNVFEISEIARLIEVSITAVILIVFAFLNNRTASVLKGIAVFITMVADIVFVGWSSIMYCVESLTDNTIERLSMGFGKEEWAIAVFFISMLVWLGAMYIFFIIDSVRSFAGTGDMKILALFFGFAAAAALVVNIVFRALIEDGVTLYYDIVPMNAGYVFLILAVFFGIIGKKKLKKQEQE